MTPAKIVRRIPRNFLKKHATIYHMEPGDSIESTLDGFKVFDRNEMNRISFSPENHNLAVSPNGKQVYIPYKEKK